MKGARRTRNLLLVGTCLGLIVSGCTSAPPMPSAGSATPTPSVGPQTSGSGAATPTPAASADASQSASGPPAGSGHPPTAPPIGIDAELATPGTLTVCTAPIGAPATSSDSTGQLVGYNIAFATEIANRLHLQPVIQLVNFAELIADIQAHTCDISVASQNITTDRLAQMNLIPYTQAKDGFPVVVKAGNVNGVKKLTDLCGLAVSAADGTTNVDQVNGTGDFAGQGLNDSCAAADKPRIDLHTFPTEEEAVQALLDDRVAAYLGNSNFVSEYQGEIQASSARLPGTHQGIAVARDHPLLTTGVRGALGEMIIDGTYLQILAQYLPTQAEVDNFSIIDTPEQSPQMTPEPAPAQTTAATPAATPTETPTP